VGVEDKKDEARKAATVGAPRPEGEERKAPLPQA
jgi:hypothetical protein